MPGLSGVDEIAARLDGVGQASKRTLDDGVLREQFVEAGDDADRRAGLRRRNRCAIEGVALFEAADGAQSFLLDQAVAVADVDVGEIAQEHRVGTLAIVFDRFEHVATVSGGDVDDAHRPVLRTNEAAGLGQQRLDVQLALADATPTDGLQIVLVDCTSNWSATRRTIAIDVVERAAGVEAGFVSELDASGETAADLHAEPRH